MVWTSYIGGFPLIPGDEQIVSPYGADIDTTIAGRVRYTNGFITPLSEMNKIKGLIHQSTNDDTFTGETRMMVAEWDRVAQYSGDAVS